MNNTDHLKVAGAINATYRDPKYGFTGSTRTVLAGVAGRYAAAEIADRGMRNRFYAACGLDAPLRDDD